MRNSAAPAAFGTDGPHPCPLCATGSLGFHDDAHGRFWRCPACALVFRDATQHLAAEDAAARYRQHRNSLDDPRYLEHLRRLADPVARRLAPGARGLDFGSGPVPAMAHLLGEHRFTVASYDPEFAPDAALLRGPYDFITCCEVLEHIPNPAEVLPSLGAMLRPDGLLGVMTQFRDESRPFADWWYRRDPTHVCFYSEPTMRHVAGRFGWRVEFPAPSVTVFLV